MANNPSPRHTLETILALIKETLGPAQQGKLRDRLAAMVGEPITAHGMLLAAMENKQQSLKEQINYLAAVLRKKKKELATAQEEIRNRIPKRTMGKARIESAEAYLNLEKHHSKKLTARLALVKLPKEMGKHYAQEYHKDKNREQLRQYVKALVRDYRKRQSRQGPGGTNPSIPAQKT